MSKGARDRHSAKGGRESYFCHMRLKLVIRSGVSSATGLDNS
jgi:hypothetical protein